MGDDTELTSKHDAALFGFVSLFKLPPLVWEKHLSLGPRHCSFICEMHVAQSDVCRSISWDSMRDGLDNAGKCSLADR